LPPPSSHATGRAVPHPAVHEVVWKRCRVSSSEIRPTLANQDLGNAWFICEAPPFHHGPRPLLAEVHALSFVSPRFGSTPALSVQVSGFDDLCRLTQSRRLVFASCSSNQRFAFGFLQIPTRPGHPCRSANSSPCRAFTSKQMRPAGRTKQNGPLCEPLRRTH